MRALLPEIRVEGERAMRLATFYVSLRNAGAFAHDAGNSSATLMTYTQAETVRGVAIALLGENTWEQLTTVARNELARQPS